jgi:hypothetical protein
MRPTRTMISPIQKLQKIIRTIPTITMIPPREMPAIPRRLSDPAKSLRRVSFPVVPLPLRQPAQPVIAYPPGCDYSCRDDQSSAARITEVTPITRPTIQPATSWPTSTAPRSTAMPMMPPVAISRMVARSTLVRRRSRPGSIPPGRSRRRASRSRRRVSRGLRPDSGLVKGRSPAAGGSPDWEAIVPTGYPDRPAPTNPSSRRRVKRPPAPAALRMGVGCPSEAPSSSEGRNAPPQELDEPCCIRARTLGSRKARNSIKPREHTWPTQFRTSSSST